MSDRFDLVVIGAGPGGYVAAIRASQLGLSVACVEKRATLGGTCLNVGCIPSKALLESSEMYVHAREHLDKHGVRVSGVKLDLAALLARKDRVVKTLTEGVAGLLKKNKITVIQGTARLAGPGRVLVPTADGGERSLETKSVLLATGSEPAAVPSLPFDGTHIVGSTEALSFDPVPEKLLVVGAGYIGLELGSVWSRLGSQVTVVEFLPRILPTADAEIADLLQRSLTRQGLKFQLETKVTGAKVQRGQVVVTAVSKNEEKQLTADRVLVAVGRRPFTEGLGLKEIGLAVEERTGRLNVDSSFQTSVPGIYAIGDLIQGPMLAHKAEDDGIAFAERLVGKKTHVDYNLVPGVIYTWPEVASVGPTEEQLRSDGREFRVGKFPFSANARARTMEERDGLVKILADAKTDRVQAVHIVGPRASDLIAECVTVMEFAGSAEDIARICHAHPTLSESVREAALAVDGKALHI